MNCLSDLLIVVIILVIIFIIIYLFQYKDEELIVDHTPRGIFKNRDYDEFDKDVNIGLQYANNCKVVICGLIRNGSKNIHKFIKKCENWCSYFKDYRILIVENDSRDNTRDLLLEWSRVNPKVIILGCGINAKECQLNLSETKSWDASKKRISKMIFLRNIYIDYIKNYLKDFDYVIVCDIDLVGSVYIDGIMNSFGKLQKNKDIDVICANGVRKYFRNFIYYDCYAHVLEGEKYHNNNKNVHSLKVLRNTLSNEYNPNMIKVKSCFGGFTIYNINSIINSKYSSDLDDALECEHTGLHSNMKNVYYNPMMINIVLENPK